MSWSWGDNKEEDIKEIRRDMDKISKLEADNARLREKLAKAEHAAHVYHMELCEVRNREAPQPPTVVKSTWQIFWADNTCSPEGTTPPDTFKQGIAIFRRDHLSDGTVTCTLESV